MSGKNRFFTLAMFAPVVPPIGVAAHSKLRLAKLLEPFLGAAPSALALKVAVELWKGKPVFLPDLGCAVLPGRFDTVHYQGLEQRALAV